MDSEALGDAEGARAPAWLRRRHGVTGPPHERPRACPGHAAPHAHAHAHAGGAADKWALWQVDRCGHSPRIDTRIPRSYKNEIYFSLICCFKPLKRWVSVLERGEYSGREAPRMSHCCRESISLTYFHSENPESSRRPSASVPREDGGPCPALAATGRPAAPGLGTNSLPRPLLGRITEMSKSPPSVNGAGGSSQEQTGGGVHRSGWRAWAHEVRLLPATIDSTSFSWPCN